jgi:hypothetical protein
MKRAFFPLMGSGVIRNLNQHWRPTYSPASYDYCRQVKGTVASMLPLEYPPARPVAIDPPDGTSQATKPLCRSFQ